MVPARKLFKIIETEKDIIRQIPLHSMAIMRLIFFIIPVIYSIPIMKDMKIMGADFGRVLATRLVAIIIFISLFTFLSSSKKFFLHHQRHIYSVGIFIIAVNLSIIAAWAKGMYFLGIVQIEIAIATFITMTHLGALTTILGINVIYITMALLLFNNEEALIDHMFHAAPPMIIFILISLLAHHIVFTYRIRDFLDNQQLASMNATLQKEIDERKEAEAASFRAEKKLVELNQMKDKMFSIIAHDLRAPLGNINSVLHLFLEQQADMDADSLRDFIEVLYKDTENTFILLENLLMWARSQRGDIYPEPVETDISDLLSGTLEIIEISAKNKFININKSLPENITAVIDPNMINTVIRNLVANAIKFTPREGTITLEAEKNKENLIFTIQDSGTGMSKETIYKILHSDDFYSTHGTDNERGSGLGMKLCRQFIEAHKGVINIESEPGVGSRFTVTIPA